MAPLSVKEPQIACAAPVRMTAGEDFLYFVRCAGSAVAGPAAVRRWRAVLAGPPGGRA
jgi:hypothetical protein